MKYFSSRLVAIAIGSSLLITPGAARAHCDGLDGPVVASARRALEKRDVKLVLRWVNAAGEPEIEKAFARAVEVRKQGGEARALADTWFFETVVRVHRAGEGAPYTGLKPAGRDLGPAVPAADAALESGKPQALAKVLDDAVRAGLHERFHKTLAARRSAAEGDVDAGRRFVAAYVDYVHWVERVYLGAAGGGDGHRAEETEAAHHQH